MKTCGEVRERLSEWLDGEAGGGERAIREHVETCAECRAELERLRRVSARIRGAAEEPRSDHVEALRRRVALEIERRRRPGAVPKLAAAASVAAGLLWSAVLLGNGEDPAPSWLQLVRGALSPQEQRLLYGPSGTGGPGGRELSAEEWMSLVLGGRSPR